MIVGRCRVGAAHRQHLAPGLGAAGPRGRACGASSPSWPAASTRRSSSASGSSRPSPSAGGALHRAQHRGDASGHGPGRGRATRPFDYNEELDVPAAAGQRRDGPQHPPARPAASSPTPTSSSRPSGPSTASTTSTWTATRSTARRPRSCISARELAPAGIPQQSWEGQHLAYTHGYGAGRGAGQRGHQPTGRPDFVLGDIPVDSGDSALDVDQPGIYFGENLDGYAIVGRHPGRDRLPDRGRRDRHQPVRRLGRGGHELVPAPGGVRPALRRRQPARSPTSSPTESRILYVRDVQRPGRSSWRRSCTSTPTRTR